MSEVPTNDWVHSSLRRKRDILIATSALTLAVPIGSTGLLLSRLIDGPKPLFDQKRVGKHGELFTIHKIRTMPSCTEDNPSAGATDKRSSKLGKILRLAAIDEIPQFYNVLSGDLSLIGPRALIEAEISEMKELLEPDLFNPWYSIYTSAGPGCVSSFGHDSHATERNLIASYRSRAESDIRDYKVASPLNDLKLIMRVGQTAAKVVIGNTR